MPDLLLAELLDDLAWLLGFSVVAVLHWHDSNDTALPSAQAKLTLTH